MGIEDLVNGPICPVCESPGERTEHWYNRCTTSSCDVLTWHTSNYKREI